MKRNIRTVAKGAGKIALALIAIDLLATIATVAFGAEFLKR